MIGQDQYNSGRILVHHCKLDTAILPVPAAIKHPSYQNKRCFDCINRRELKRREIINQQQPLFAGATASIVSFFTLVFGPGVGTGPLSSCCCDLLIVYISVRIFWKASSTFDASKADVSMKARLFFSEVT